MKHKRTTKIGKYVRIVKSEYPPGGLVWNVWLRVDSQNFRVTPFGVDTLEEARWVASELKSAIETIQRASISSLTIDLAQVRGRKLEPQVEVPEVGLLPVS